MSSKLKSALNIATQTTNNGVRANSPVPNIEAEVTESDILIEMQRLNKESNAAKKITPKFPIDAFPLRIKNILSEFYRTKPYPMDYYGMQMLSVSAGLIGVGYCAEFNGDEHYPILYSILVGDSSAGKSITFKYIKNILIRIQSNLDNEHQVAMGAWRVACDMAKMENPKTTDLPKPPVEKKVLVGMDTMESLLLRMKDNPRGFLRVQEEVLAWINSMNQYRSGADEQVWLENFDAAYYTGGTVSKGTVVIPKLNCNLIGGIQPDLLHNLFANGKGKSGATARLIYSYPDDTEAQYYCDTPAPVQSCEELYKILKFVNELPTRMMYADDLGETRFEDSIKISLNKESGQLYVSYFNKLVDISNGSDDDRLKAMIGKLQTYTMRFALIIELLQQAENTVFGNDEWGSDWSNWEWIQENIKISKQSMLSAIKFTEYFRYTGEKVLQRMETPVDAMKQEYQNWYKALPVKGIKWNVAVKAAEKAGFKKNTANKLLNNGLLFKKSGENYERRFI
jgi:hypothetical protein